MRVLQKLALALVITAVATGAMAEHRLGGGARYHQTLGGLLDDPTFDKDGLSWIASYQYVPGGIFKVEADLEFMPSSLTGGDSVLVPQVYAILGGGIYGGIGMGLFDFEEDFFALRAGLDMGILGDALRIDLNANYLFTDFDQLSDIDTDNLTLAVIARTTF